MLLHDENDCNMLLENTDSSILSILRENLEETAVNKLANLCYSQKGKKIFSERDVKAFLISCNPVDSFIDELIKRNVTFEYLLQLLKKGEFVEVLTAFGIKEKLSIESQSASGLIFLPRNSEFKITVKAHGIPLPTYQWYKEEDPLFNETTAELSLEKFDIEQEGIYLCLISHEEENHFVWSSPVQLCLEETPPIFNKQFEESEMYLVEGDKLELKTCVKGHPFPSISWYQNDLKLNYSTENIQIDGVSLSNRGTYKCVIENKLGRVESARVLVRIAPNFCSSDPEIINEPNLYEESAERSIGQAISLVCSARASQNLLFTWIVNGKHLEGTSSPRHIIMTSSEVPNFSSSLFYTINNEDGSTVKILCMVQSSTARRYSKEIKVKVVNTDDPVKYTAGMKWALLIANTEYDVGPLPPLYTPSSDMEKICAELTQMDFRCVLLHNLDLIAMKNAVLFMSHLIKQGDYVVFCYAGHGVYSGVDFLMPIPHGRHVNEIETISSLWVRSTLQKNEPALFFVVFDMCRHVHYSNLDGSTDASKISAQRNCVVLNATSEGYQSLEDPKSASVLTSALVKHLRKDVNLVALAQNVLRDVAHMSAFVRKEQIPKLDVNLSEHRSLTDPQAFVDVDREKIWSNFMKQPEPIIFTTKLLQESIDITIIIGMENKQHGVLSNVHTMYVNFSSDVQANLLEIVFDYEEMKEISRNEKQFIYQFNAVNKRPDDVAMKILDKSSKKEIFFSLIPLSDFSRVKFYSKDFEPDFLATPALYNVV